MLSQFAIMQITNVVALCGFWHAAKAPQCGLGKVQYGLNQKRAGHLGYVATGRHNCDRVLNGVRDEKSSGARVNLWTIVIRAQRNSCRMLRRYVLWK
jgi:hypothetical protein